MIIDSHSHLFDKHFDADREAVIARMLEAGVGTITVGTSWQDSVDAVAFAERLGMWATAGQHPTDTFEEFDYAKYKKLAENKCVVGIGECGLDYVQSKFSKLPLEVEKERQKLLFEQQIGLAKELDKPLMLHIRDAYSDAYEILKNKSTRGTVHFFGGDWEVGKKFLDLGFTLSFPGTITFTNQYDEVVKNVPDDMFLIETDAPYVAPAPYRGKAADGRAKRNEPAYVLEVAKRVGGIRGISPEQAAEIATKNARRVFAI
jgi:TatD DNase family protein